MNNGTDQLHCYRDCIPPKQEPVGELANLIELQHDVNLNRPPRQTDDIMRNSKLYPNVGGKFVLVRVLCGNCRSTWYLHKDNVNEDKLRCAFCDVQGVIQQREPTREDNLHSLNEK